METFPALHALCAGNSSVTDEFPAQRPVTRIFDVFSDLRRLNKRLSKQSWCWWFETSLRSLWRHCNDLVLGDHSGYVLSRWEVSLSEPIPRMISCPPPVSLQFTMFTQSAISQTINQLYMRVKFLVKFPLPKMVCCSWHNDLVILYSELTINETDICKLCRDMS